MGKLPSLHVPGSRGRNAGSFTRAAAGNQSSLYCLYMYLLQVFSGSPDCFSLSFVIGPSKCCLFEGFSTECHKSKTKPMKLFGDAAAVLDAIVSNCYYMTLGVEGGCKLHVVCIYPQSIP